MPAKPETFRIEADLPVVGYLTACIACGRKILVEIVLNGINHNAIVRAKCGECVQISEGLAEQSPAIAQQIEAWKASGGIKPANERIARLRSLLDRARQTIEILADQQAVENDCYSAVLADIAAELS